MNANDVTSAIKDGVVGRAHGGQSRRLGGAGISTKSLRGIVEYSPAELTISALAGTPMRELEDTILNDGQILPFEPMQHNRILGTKGVATLGGALGVNADGPRRFRTGAMRDALLGVEFIDGRGQLIRAGGKVMKNVTGLDMVRLFAGSAGQIGVATKITMRLLPRARSIRSIAYDRDVEAAMNDLGRILRMPLDITGAHYLDGRLFIRQEGADNTHVAAKLENEMGQGQEVDPSIWIGLRDWEYLSDADEIWRIFVRPSQVLDIVGKFDRRYIIAAAGSQIIVDGGLRDIAPLLLDGVFAVCEKGNVIGARAPHLPSVHQELIDRTIKVFDPNGIFSG